jgi:hypothetical protein
MTHKEILFRIGNVTEYKPLKEYLEGLEIELTDIRKIQDKSPESLKAHELASVILRDKIIRYMSSSKGEVGTDDYY